MRRSLVVGYGSIGKRHARVLKGLGGRVSVVSRRVVEHKPLYKDLRQALKNENPHCVVVANETSEHGKTLRTLKKVSFAGSVLVEKPLFASPESLPGLKSIFVAYNFRFHPGVVRLRRLLQGEKILSAQFYVGGYLPDWRPGTDYRKGYSASRKRGGGALRDLSHELDLALWLFGKWKRVAAIGGHFSRLKISSDDAFGLLLAAERCPLITVQVNYFDRPGHREILVNTERHTYKLDLLAGKLWIDRRAENVAAERDSTYRAEHAALLGKDRRNLCTAAQGLEVLRLIRAAEKASRTKRWVSR